MGKAASYAAATRRTTSRTGATAESTTTISESAANILKMKRKKKKGRPSLLDLQKRQQSKTLTPVPTPTPHPPAPIYNSASARRSSRRNPVNYNSPSSEFVNNDYDDDDERQQKKVKLVVRLPQSSEHPFRDSPSQDSAASGSDSDADGVPNPDASPKKRKINAVDRRSNDAVLDQGEKAVKVTDSAHGSPLESGPTTPLPDKTMLVFVLDRLQKKDTYGVFSEPVDPNELPDYHEIIEHPMDFGTVRKKLDDGVYSNLEELEVDVMLICSNAMQYNAPDTIYFRQARSIEELAKRDFENLRNEGDNGEPQPKVVRRGRPPSKNLKKPFESSPAVRAGLEHSSGATLASGEDKANGPNGYNLRKGPTLQRFRLNDTCATSYRPRNGENYSDLLIDWNSEFPASILRADMKYGKKHFSVDENKRATYKQLQASPSSSKQSCILNGFGDMRRLMAVGVHLDSHPYARSLARYAANLGPVAWNVASRKLKSALPDGLAFGLGWVEENDKLTEPLPFSAEKLKLIMNGLVCRPVNPSVPDLSCAVLQRFSGEMIEAGKRLSCPNPNELANQDGGLPWTIAGSSFQLPQKSVLHPSRNGLNGMYGFDLSSQTGSAGVATQAGQSGLEEGSIVNQMLGMESAMDVSSLHPGPLYQASSEETKLSDNRGVPQCGNPLGQASGSHVMLSAAQHRQAVAIPPDLNIRVQASGSPSSSLQIGSPQPDLALQL